MRREDYMRNPTPEAHRAYYGQFTTPAIQAMIADYIGIEKLRASTDPHFNDIPLARWDSLQSFILRTAGRKIATTQSGGVSLSDCVCVAKEAARRFLETPT